MGKILFLIILFILLIGGFFGFSVGRFFGGASQNKSTNRKNQPRPSQKQQEQSKSAKKIISKDEGEYIDYVEIKD